MKTPRPDIQSPAAVIIGRLEGDRLCYELTQQSFSLKPGEELHVYTMPPAPEEIESITPWRGRHAVAVNQRDTLAGAIAEHFRVELGDIEPWNVALQVLDGNFATDSDNDRERNRLRAELAELVTMCFKMTGASGAKRKQHTDALVERLHLIQSSLVDATDTAMTSPASLGARQ
ncbi:hypothetical protein [Pseudomonas lactis]|uniref:hypothetical protein n=1 Tax=Pseudomonas lactis TaxID=1615674 RepID=UPI003F7D6B51